MSPFPNEHACRLKDPGGYQDDSFRRITRDKRVIIVARPKGETTTEAQAYRYPIGDWTEEAARAACTEAKGNFEAATGEKAMVERIGLMQKVVNWLVGDSLEAVAAGGAEWGPAVLVAQ